MNAAKGKRVLVTAGGRGIGAAVTRNLARSGYDVSITYRESGQAADALLAELETAYPEQTFEGHRIDLADREAVDGFAGCHGDATWTSRLFRVKCQWCSW